MSSLEYCNVCSLRGKTSQLRVYQINFDEAVRFCEDAECTYPVGQMSPETLILNRKYTDISPKKKASTGATILPQKPGPLSTRKKFQNVIPCSSSVKKILGSSINQACSPSSRKVLNPYNPGKLEKTQNQEVHRKEKLTLSLEQGIINTNPAFKILPQWQNREALCWLDVVMCLFVHCKKLQDNIFQKNGRDETVLCTLLTAYNQACSILNMTPNFFQDTPKFPSNLTHPNDKPTISLQKTLDLVKTFQHMSVVDSKVKTGAGMKFSSEIGDEANVIEDRFLNAFNILRDVRETVFDKLQPKLQCVKGKNDSPLFAIPLLIKGDSCVEELMMMKYRFEFHCRACGYRQSDPCEQVLPTIPKPPQNISSAEPTVERSCFKCRAPWQQRKMVFEKLSEVVVLHFVEGLQSNDIESLSFSFGGKYYKVRGLIQYLNNPDHFVTWIYNSEEKTWMECDDLKSPVCQYQSNIFQVPAQQIHIVMWESSSPQEKKNSEIKMHVDSSKHQVKNPTVKNRQNSRTDIVMSDLPSTPKESAESAGVETEAVISLPSSALMPNMMVKLTNTGQLVQVNKTASINPSPVPKLGQVSQCSMSQQTPREHASEFAGNCINTKVSTTGPSNSSSVYTPSFLKSLIQKKSKSSLVLQAERQTGKSRSTIENSSILAKLTGGRSTSFKTPALGKKKFEGYFSPKNSKPSNENGSRLVRSSSVSSMSRGSSRSNSPTLSCYSDTYTLQKRKLTSRKEGSSKKRRSICSESSTSSPESMQVEESIDVPSAEGCDVLQNLYHALNLSLPENFELRSSTNILKSPEETLHGDESIPDVQDLTDFIDSPNNPVTSSLDEFLAQL